MSVQCEPVDRTSTDPELLERSMQAKFLQPVVVALAFGVFIAFFVTLLMVPALYAIGADMVRYRARFKQWISRKVFRRGAETDSGSSDSVSIV